MITQDDVIYMIVTDRFEDGDYSNNGPIDRSDPEGRHGGDLLGIIRRLPYLEELGVTALWITPVYTNPVPAYHGYHPLDFESVDPHLCSPELGRVGDPAVVRRFVELVHEHRQKVILDTIICHTAPNHPWLTERPGWFNVNSSDPVKWWIWGLPDLNHDNIDVNLYFGRNALWWIQTTGVDGVRVDAARHVETYFWHVFKLFTKGPCPEITLIGEVWDADVTQVAPYQSLHGFDAMFDYPLYHAIVDVFARDFGFGRIARPEIRDDEPAGVLNLDHAYRNAFQLITFLDNHDTPRFFHLAGGYLHGTEAIARTKLAMTFLFTTRGIPQLYYGAELAMDGGAPPNNRQDMPWSLMDGAGPDTENAATAHDMLGFTRRLIALRKSSTALRYGLLITLFVTDTLYAYARVFADDMVDVRIVVLNNAQVEVDAIIPLQANPRLPSVGRAYLTDGAELFNDFDICNTTRIVNGCLRVCLPGKSGGVYHVAPGASVSGPTPTTA